MGKVVRYRTPVILTTGIAVVLGIVAVSLFTSRGADNSQATERPQKQISEPVSTAFAATDFDKPGAPSSEPATSEPLVVIESKCGSGEIAIASHQGDESSLTVMDGGVSAGNMVLVPIVLSNAPAGLAGYDVRLNVEDPSIARIAGIDFPDFGLVREFEASDQRARISAADLFQLVEVGDTDSTLATVTVQGESKGATLIKLSIVQMDDDSGDPMTPKVYSGTVTVC